MGEMPSELTLDWLRATLKAPFKVAAGTSVVFCLLLLGLPNQYRSEARLLPGDGRQMQGISQLAALASGLGIGGLNQDSDAIYTDILGSRWLHERLLGTTFEFKERTWRFGSEKARKATWREFLDAGSMDRSLDASRARLQVRRDLKTRTLTLEVETRSPSLSQQVVKRVVELLGEFLLKGAQTRGGMKAQFAAARLAEAQATMAKAETQLKRFLQMNRNYVVSADPDVRVEGARLEGELRLRQQVVMTLATLQEQALMEEKNDIPLLNVLDGGNLPEEKSRPHRAVMALAWFAVVFLVDWLRRVHPELRAALAGRAGA